MAKRRKKSNPNATKIVIATSEIRYLPKEWDPAGIVKTGDGGGLASIIAATIEEGWKQGLDIHVIIPEYFDLFRRQAKGLSEDDFEDALTGVAMHPNVHLIDDGLFLNADRVYNDDSYALRRIDVRRAIHLSKGVVRTGREMNRAFPKADKIFQLNEWLTAIAAAGLKAYDRQGKIKTEMKWHNTISYEIELFKLNNHGFNTQRYHKKLYYTNGFPSDDHGKDMYRLKADFLTSGFLAADQTTTVSPQFLEEAVNGTLERLGIMPGFMADMIKHRFWTGHASAILNAPMAQADPSINPYLEHKYGTDDIIEGKMINKGLLQKKAGLFQDNRYGIHAWLGRLMDPQKGARMYIEIAPELLHTHQDMQIVFVANGEKYLVERAQALQRDFPGRVSYMQFNDYDSNLAMAGGDFLPLPSWYEPCGSPHLEGPNFGTWPLVMATGGLLAIHDFAVDESTGNGWIHKTHDYGGLRYVTGEAMRFHRQPVDYKRFHLQRAREANLKEHNIANMVKYSRDVWEYMLDKDKRKKLILR